GSVQQYTEQLADPDSHRPGHCPQCHTKHPLTAHGFYTRTLVDTAFDGVIRVRRYLCQACQRTVSLLPEFVLPYLRSSLAVIALLPAGLAPRSGSRRPPRRILLLRRARLSHHTHHLHGTVKPFSLRFETGEKLHGRQSRKSRAVSLRAHRPPGFGNAAARRTHAPCARTRRPPL